MKNILKNKKAFTMLELGIVFMVLAIGITTVLGARSMIKSANVSNAQNLTSNSPVLNIDGLVFWVETSMDSNDVVTDATVASWSDISPSGFTITVNGNPTYVDSEILKGLKTIECDGTGDYFNTDNIINAVKYTAFAVINPYSTAADADVIFHNGNSTGWGITEGDIDTVSAPRVIAITNDTSTNKKTVYVNDESGVETSADNPASISTAFYICSTAGSNDFNGEVAEVIVFNRVLFADEITEVQNYLKKKYSLHF